MLSVDDKTPFEVWFRFKPPPFPIHSLHTFGCVAHVKNGGKYLTN